MKNQDVPITMNKPSEGKKKVIYTKRLVRWDWKSKSHNRPICGGIIEVSRDEFDENIKESKKFDNQAFLGNLKRDYWLYGKN